MYYASQLDRSTTCCLTDCQLIRHLPKEEQRAAGAHASINVIVLDEVLCTGTRRVVQAIVEGAHDVADDPLDGLLVLHHQSLHEPTDVANGER
jgi:hypothetical protein